MKMRVTSTAVISGNNPKQEADGAKKKQPLGPASRAALPLLVRASVPTLHSTDRTRIDCGHWRTEDASGSDSGELRRSGPIESGAFSLGPSDPMGIAQALRESREELRRLSGMLVSIQEDERKRIALDLHDGLGQAIGLIKLSIENTARLLASGAVAQAGQSLEQLIPRVQEAMVEVRRVSTELRPLILDDLGIMATLSWFFREFKAVCGAISLDQELHVTEQDVPVQMHITLYRILQEATHNIIKHAAADRVRIRLDRVGDELHLEIEDNGRGFDPSSIELIEGQTRGLGLLSIKERASVSGGRYQLRSAPGQGTFIKVTWPAT